ncbi:MAG: hypothetical protein Q9213_002962 [Squamulea squamosa]
MSTIVIAEDGDLMVEVIEFNYETRDANNKPVIGKKQNFRVSRDVMAESSDVWKVLFHSQDWKEAGQDVIKLQDDSVVSMEVWFQLLHGTTTRYDISLYELWHLAAAGKKYRLNITDLKPWFEVWYKRQQIDSWYQLSLRKELRSTVPNPRALLYPCWIFDHIKGFMRIT